MYLSHFGLNEPPFRITPDTGFFFAGANRGATLDALQYAILHEEGIVKVSGEVGSGKTMLCRVLIERLPKTVEIIYLANPSLARDEILLAIADELGMNPEMASAPGTRLLKGLHEKLISLYSEGRRVVVLVDEAHAMPKETLEEIRLLSNLESRHNKLLHLVLFGQPELDTNLDSAEMRPLKERITHSFRLEPLIRTDVEGYIEFRLRAAGYRGPNPFAAGAVRLISDASQGLTRRINILCDKSLLAAFAADSHAVTEREARRAIADSTFTKMPRKISHVKLAIAGVAAGLAAGLAIAWAWIQSGPPRSAAPATPVTSIPTAPTAMTSPDQGADSRSLQAAETPAMPVIAGLATELKLQPQISGGSPAPAYPEAGLGKAPKASVTPSGHPAGSSVEVSKPPAPARMAAGPSRHPESTPSSTTDSGVRELSATFSSETQRPSASPEPPGKGKLVQKRFVATQDWFKRAPPDNFSIQLVAAKSTELAQLEDFLRMASELVGEDDLYVYSVRFNGEQYYRVAYGNYVNLGEVREAMKTLPSPFLAQQPFPRSFARMRRHNSQ